MYHVVYVIVKTILLPNVIEKNNYLHLKDENR